MECDCEVEHAPGRGEDLKQTEAYTFELTDLMHTSFMLDSDRAISQAFVAIRFRSSSHLVAMPAPAVSDILSKVEEGNLKSVLDRVSQWERLAVETRAQAITCAFTDPEQRIKAIGSVRQNLGDLLSATIRGGNNREVYGNFVDLMKRVPECCLIDVPCPPEGEADVILVGDSSIALVSHQPAPPGEKPQYSTITVGDLVSRKKLPWMSTLTTAMVWGGKLADLVSKADTMAQEILDRNEVECNGRRVIIFIAWSGNDVFGEGGYVGCRWIHQARYLKSEADRKVAADWPLNQKARVQAAINALPALKNRPGVWDLVLVGNADVS